MKYTFRCENEDFEYPEGATITVEFSADNLSDVLNQFGYFLKGSGFVLDGEVDIVNNDSSDSEEFFFDDDGDEEYTNSLLQQADTMISSPNYPDTLNFEVK